MLGLSLLRLKLHQLQGCSTPCWSCLCWHRVMGGCSNLSSWTCISLQYSPGLELPGTGWERGVMPQEVYPGLWKRRELLYSQNTLMITLSPEEAISIYKSDWQWQWNFKRLKSLNRRPCQIFLRLTVTHISGETWLTLKLNAPSGHNRQHPQQRREVQGWCEKHPSTWHPRFVQYDQVSYTSWPSQHIIRG